MGQLLKPGQKLLMNNSRIACTVEEFIGGGGQGEVYKVIGDQNYAVKWYFPEYLREDTDLKRRIETLINYGAPDENFLWPLDLMISAEEQEETEKSFGYVMLLRQQRFKSFKDFINVKVHPKFRTLASIGYELARSFLDLHAKGLSYKDINFGNVFFDPDTGEIRICDNDNVDEDKAPGTIIGTPKFMAPEIVRGEAGPSSYTDLYSLAVLLFYLLMANHPLEGNLDSKIQCFDLEEQQKLYGEHPVFIYDPEDDSNRPDPERHKNVIRLWDFYPRFIRKLFEQAFTTGLTNPESRIRESEWKNALIRLKDSIHYCSNCSEEIIHDFENSDETSVCWFCKKPLASQMYLEIGSQKIIINHDTELFLHHVDKDQQFEFSEPIAKVVRHPNDPSRSGFRNLSDSEWKVAASGKEFTIEKGRATVLVPDMEINFGKQTGTIKVLNKE
ncbi:protein kinase domain-containing protein [Mesotoga prima]|uniref:protein kinase domain-containing protein n=1 Tax=Mesotoga prima TaxID=1184387 RepID=UPI002CA2E006|nr:hypothetical protein [Mesotoga prima]HNQ71520.1 hypothetical protein [Mesotoga prima]HNS76176.1 hypothetical protein [Mesotoga prima]